jgi:hypothetical protein
MSWPSLSESCRAVDWSIFNWEYRPWPIKKPKDVQKFLADHPKIEVAILRFGWPDGSPDPYYPTYFDEFTDAGVKVMSYGWPNKHKSPSAVMEDWKRALGDRVPRVLWSDWEDAYVLSELSQFQMQDLMRKHYLSVANHFPDQAQGFYGRGGWLDEHVGSPPEWFYEIDWWVAHWPFPPPDFKNQATSFAELDAMLPIDNNFTPYRGKVVKIPVNKVKGWQATSDLDGHGDAGYFLRSYIDQKFDGAEPEPAPIEKPEIEVRVVKGEATIKVIE